jgi:hypothetical protein
MAVSGPGASVKRAAEKLGCTTRTIYRCLGRLCEVWAEDRTVWKHGPRPERGDPEWNVWQQAWYQNLVRERKTFGLRTRGPWILNGTLKHARGIEGSEAT